MNGKHEEIINDEINTYCNGIKQIDTNGHLKENNSSEINIDHSDLKVNGSYVDNNKVENKFVLDEDIEKLLKKIIFIREINNRIFLM